MKHVRQCHPEQEHSCLACGQVAFYIRDVFKLLKFLIGWQIGWFGILEFFTLQQISTQAASSKTELSQHLAQHTDPGPAYLACER